MAQDKQALMQLVNMLAGTLQGIGQQRQQQSMQRQQVGMQRAQMEMQVKDLKMKADFNKATLADRKAQRDLEALDREMALDAQAGQASTATGFAQPGGVEGLKSTGVETQWEQTFAAMTPEQQQNPSYLLGAFEGLGGAAAMREDMPSAAEIYDDVQAYAALSLGNPDIEIPEYLQSFSGNIDYMRGEREKAAGREDVVWDNQMMDAAFRQGEMVGFDENVKSTEVPYPEGLEAGYEQFFYAGVRKTQEALKQGRRSYGGGGGGVTPPADTGGGPQALSAVDSIKSAFVIGGESSGREEAERQWAAMTEYYKVQEGAEGLYEWFKVNLGVLDADTMSPEALHDTFMQYTMQQAGFRAAEPEAKQPSTFKGVSSTFRGGP